MYGVAANALNTHAVKNVYKLKQRPGSMPILVLVPSKYELSKLVKNIPENAEKLMSAFWPGRLTLIFDARDSISPLLTSGTGKLGIRQPGHPVAQALAKAVDFPITGTSANLSGQPSTFHPDQLPQPILDQASLVLDAGTLKGGTGSTIVDLTTDPVTIIREGQIPAIRILDLIGS